MKAALYSRVRVLVAALIVALSVLASQPRFDAASASAQARPDRPAGSTVQVPAKDDWACTLLMERVRRAALAGKTLGDKEAREALACVKPSRDSRSRSVSPAPGVTTTPIACFQLGNLLWEFDDAGNVEASGPISIWGAPSEIAVHGQYFGVPAVFSVFFFSVNAVPEAVGAFPVGFGLGFTLGTGMNVAGWVGFAPLNLSGTAASCTLI